MRKRIGASALVLLLIVTLFAGCDQVKNRPDPARGLEVVIETLMTRDRSAMEAYYPDADLSTIKIDEGYEKGFEEKLKNPILGFSLTGEQIQKLIDTVYSVLERMEYKTELKEQNGDTATVLLKLQSVNIGDILENLPDDLAGVITQRATEEKVDLNDEKALIAVAVDVISDYWVKAAKDAELTESAEGEITMRWTNGCWLPDEEALIALIGKVIGNESYRPE